MSKEASSNEGSFTLLLEHEFAPIFQDGCRLLEQIVFWVKGEKNKFTFELEGFNSKTYSIQISPKNSELNYPIEKYVLGNAHILGLQLFISGSLHYDKLNNVYYLKLDKVYKFERRKNFRIPLSAKKTAQFYIHLPEDLKLPSNVVNLGKAGEQTKLFASFMELIRKNNSDSEKANMVHFKIQDISSSGIALIIGELETRFIIEGAILNNCILHFGEKDFVIPKAKIVYIMDYIDPIKPGTKLFKSGIQFIDLPEDIDNEISKLLSKELRNHELSKVFEDFLK